MRILVTGNLGYIGPILGKFLKSYFSDSYLIGLDSGLFLPCFSSYDRIGDTFYNDVDSLYCFTKLRNEGIKQEVRHVWFYEDRIMTQVRYNVKNSKVYRSWTKKTISPFQIGNWRVEIQNKRGDIIGQTSFVIKEK